MLRFLPGLIVLSMLSGCSGYVSYEHRDFWRNAQLVYESPDQDASQDPSIDPGDSIVMYICDRGIPGNKLSETTSAHGYATSYTIQIPGDLKVGDVINVTGEDGAIAYTRFTGHSCEYLDRAAPASAQVQIISLTEDKLKARIKAEFISVEKQYGQPPEERWREQVHYRGTETFSLQREYREGEGRMVRRITAEVEARKKANPAAVGDR